MRVKIIHQGRVTIIEDPAQVLVEENDSTPLAVAAKTIEGVVLVSSVDSPERFNAALRRLGLNRSVIVTNLRGLERDPAALPHVL